MGEGLMSMILAMFWGVGAVISVIVLVTIKSVKWARTNTLLMWAIAMLSWIGALALIINEVVSKIINPIKSY